jgi:hypothetical protein
VRFIYEKGIRPKIVTGTSVGAINGVKLAEGDDPPGPTAKNAQQKLEDIWKGLRDEDDMFGRMPWVNQLANNDIKEAIVDGMWGGGPRDPDPELEQLSPDPLVAPPGVLPGQPENEVPDLGVQGGSTGRTVRPGPRRSLSYCARPAGGLFGRVASSCR